jgi:hypothetical protein
MKRKLFFRSNNQNPDSFFSNVSVLIFDAGNWEHYIGSESELNAIQMRNLDTNPVSLHLLFMAKAPKGRERNPPPSARQCNEMGTLVPHSLTLLASCEISDIQPNHRYNMP